MKKHSPMEKLWPKYFLFCASAPLLLSLLIVLLLYLIVQLIVVLNNSAIIPMDINVLIALINLSLLHYLITRIVIQKHISIPPGYSLIRNNRKISCFILNSKEELIKFHKPIWLKGKMLSINEPSLELDSKKRYTRFFHSKTYLICQNTDVLIKLPIILKFKINTNPDKIKEILQSNFEGGDIRNYFVENFHKLQDKKQIEKVMKTIKPELIGCKYNYFNDRNFIDSLRYFIKIPPKNRMFTNIVVKIKKPEFENIV